MIKNDSFIVLALESGPGVGSHRGTDVRQQELLAKLAEPPGADFGDLMRESAIVQEKLDKATAEWEKAMEKLEEVLAANAAIHDD